MVRTHLVFCNCFSHMNSWAAGGKHYFPYTTWQSLHWTLGYDPLGSDTLCSGTQISTFISNLLPPSSEYTPWFLQNVRMCTDHKPRDDPCWVGVRVWRGAGTLATVTTGCSTTAHRPETKSNSRGVLWASTLSECFQDCRYMEHPRWCNIHEVYLLSITHNALSVIRQLNVLRPFAIQCTFTHCIHIFMYV